MINFIGIGAQKAGTSWLYACLYEHPEICAPIKEIHFFSRERFVKGKKWYEHHFRNCKQGLKLGEFSTSYLFSKEAATRIYEYYPDVKLIVVLRNPIERAYSQYRNAIKAGEITGDVSFESYIISEPSTLSQGKYVEQLKNYYTYFKKDQILTLIYEDSKKDPASYIKNVYTFLGVDSSFVPTMLHRTVNVARTPKFVGIDVLTHKVAEFLRRIGLDTFVWIVKKSGVTDVIRSVNSEVEADEVFDRERVSHIFSEDVKELSALLGRDMSSEWNI